jgi:pyruvyltransferase
MPVLRGPIGRRIPIRRPVDNFGDLLGPMLVARILEERGTDANAGADRRLLTVGSIMHFAEPGDVVWGTGINGKRHGLPKHDLSALSLDVRAVRGPLTRRVLVESGITVSEVYGDPGLLWSRFWPREHYVTQARQAVGIVPNLHDWARYESDPRAINPRGPVHEVIGRIAQCDFIASTSLHGIVIAESFGIPARLVPPTTEPMLKYHDYYTGTGRDGVRVAATVAHAIEMGGETPPAWNGDALLDAFPHDLWR